MGLNAADYALIGAFGAAAISQAGAVYNSERSRRHERFLALAAARRTAYQRLLSASSEFGRRARTIARIAESGGSVSPVRREEYLNARRELAHAIAGARLYATGDMRAQLESLGKSRLDVHAWLAGADTGIRNESNDPQVSDGRDDALAKLEACEDATIDAARPQLGVS